MLENLSALAIVPKAKAIAARRLSHSDYLELMRKRSVIEVTAALQSHPYFKDSLKGLSQTNLHRAQIEEALSKDVYYKYESLMRYSFRKGKFGAYFLMRSETNELLAKLRLLSHGLPASLYHPGARLSDAQNQLQPAQAGQGRKRAGLP